MATLRVIALICGALLLACAAAQSPVPGYPGKPIRLIVPISAGSSTDIIARLIASRLQQSWGQQVVADNRPSAGGTVGGGIVASATPDGYTLMLTSAAFAGSVVLYPNLPYDALKDFAAVTQVASTPLLLLVAPGLGVKNVKELIALARQKPGQINFGSAGIGSGTHFAGELFKHSAGINVTHVPYKGTPESLNDTMAGRIQFCMAAMAAVVPLVKSGRLLALAVTTSDRSPLLPEVPSMAEAALPGFDFDGWYGMLAPARTPRPIINALSGEVGRILRLPEVRERIEGLGASARPTSPEEFEKYVRAEIIMRGKIAKAAGARPE